MDKIETAFYYAVREFMVTNRGYTIVDATKELEKDHFFSSVTEMSTEYKKNGDLGNIAKHFNFIGNESVEDVLLLQNYAKKYL